MMKKQKLGIGFLSKPHAGKEAEYIENSSILNSFIRPIKTQHTFLVSDSCFSGSLFVEGSSRSGYNSSAELEKYASRWALCSGRKNEEVHDGVPGGNSPFAKSFLSFLNRNTQASFPVSRLVDFVVEQTASQYRQLPRGNPLFQVGHEGGQFIFHAKNSSHTGWERAKDSQSISKLAAFISQYPESGQISTAKELIQEIEDDNYWKKCLTQGTLTSLITYKTKFPAGRHIDKADLKIKAWSMGTDTEPCNLIGEKEEVKIKVSYFDNSSEKVNRNSNEPTSRVLDTTSTEPPISLRKKLGLLLAVCLIPVAVFFSWYKVEPNSPLYAFAPIGPIEF